MPSRSSGSWPPETTGEQISCWSAGCSVPLLLGLTASGVLVGAGNDAWWLSGAAVLVGGTLTGVLLRPRMSLLLAPGMTMATLFLLGMLDALAGLRPTEEGGDPFPDGLIAIIAMVVYVPLALVGALVGIIVRGLLARVHSRA